MQKHVVYQWQSFFIYWHTEHAYKICEDQKQAELKKTVKDDEILDDHTADYEPDKRGWEDIVVKHPKPNGEWIWDEMVAPAVAVAVAHP